MYIFQGITNYKLTSFQPSVSISMSIQCGIIDKMRYIYRAASYPKYPGNTSALGLDKQNTFAH